MTTQKYQQYDPWPFRWQREKYFHSWFAWIEWLGLTAALITGTIKSQELILQFPIGILAILSTIFVYFSGMVGISLFLSAWLIKVGVPASLRNFVAILAGIFITLSLLWSLVSVFMALTQGTT